jgi:hypothetical protein
VAAGSGTRRWGDIAPMMRPAALDSELAEVYGRREGTVRVGEALPQLQRLILGFISWLGQ